MNMRVHERGGGGGGAPTGWPVGNFIGPSVYGAAGINPTANKLEVMGLGIGYQVQFSNIFINVDTADGAHLYDVGLYNSLGTLVADIGAQALPSTGIHSFAVVGAPVTINPGLYFFAFTGNSALAAIKGQSNSNPAPLVYSYSPAYGASVGGALPASITPPSEGGTSALLIFGLG